MESTLILRIGEVFLKGSNRHLFLRRLERNIRDALRGSGSQARLHRFHGRYMVSCPSEDLAAVVACVQKVFGLTSISRVVSCEPVFDQLAAEALDFVQRLPEKPRSFRVSARRTDKSLPFDSLELEREIGGLIHETCHIPVNLKNPEMVVEIHAGRDISFVCAEREPAFGGLPVGMSGRMEVLLSGGIDSPVALWMMLKRGATVNATTFYSPPWTGEEPREKVETLCRLLRPWGGPNRLHVIAYGEAQKILRECRPHKLATVLYRRLMMRTTAYIARRNRALALVTGESLGQVASQTLANMVAIDAAAGIPVIRPLVGFDKSETIELARRIGTYETSIIPCVDSCTLFAPDHPETHARMEEIAEAEKDIDVDEMARSLADNALCLRF